MRFRRGRGIGNAVVSLAADLGFRSSILVIVEKGFGELASIAWVL